jgi:ferredoxin
MAGPDPEKCTIGASVARMLPKLPVWRHHMDAPLAIIDQDNCSHCGECEIVGPTVLLSMVSCWQDDNDQPKTTAPRKAALKQEPDRKIFAEPSTIAQSRFFAIILFARFATKRTGGVHDAQV